MTRGQQRALREPGDALVQSPPGTLVDWAASFGRSAPLGLEIGFGMGHALLDWARAAPDWNLLGLEVYQPGIGALLLGIEQHDLTNVRVLEADANEALEQRLAPASLDEVRIYFPDPWPKKRHHKRRLVQPAFVALLAARLRPGGRLLLATDWEPYAHWMLEVLEAAPALENLAPGGFAERGRRPGGSRHSLGVHPRSCALTCDLVVEVLHDRVAPGQQRA